MKKNYTIYYILFEVVLVLVYALLNKHSAWVHVLLLIYTSAFNLISELYFHCPWITYVKHRIKEEILPTSVYSFKPLYFYKPIFQIKILDGVRQFRGYSTAIFRSPQAILDNPSEFKPFSPKWCDEKKLIFLKNLPATFDNMANLRNPTYLAKTAYILKLEINDLKNKAGVYMIYNKINKKIYIGKSKDLRVRFYNYLDLIRLNNNRASRIHKALLKYGFENFSVSILEFCRDSPKLRIKKGDGTLAEELNNKEDIYIRIFKPQYNIARSKFNKDISFGARTVQVKDLILPTKIKNILDKCVDPSALDWLLVSFDFSKAKSAYKFSALTPKGYTMANSIGWNEGDISTSIGLIVRKTKTLKPIPKELLKLANLATSHPKLADLFTKGEGFKIRKQLKQKLKAISFK